MSLPAISIAHTSEHAVALACPGAAGIDIEHDEADIAAGKKIECPVNVLWGDNAAMGRQYDVLGICNDGGACHGNDGVEVARRKCVRQIAEVVGEKGVDQRKIGAQRGFVVMAPAYPLLANYQPDWRALGYQSGTMKAIWDNIRALDYLESLPFVQPGKFAAVGHSLGGHNAMFVGAFDPRLKVVVSSCGWTLMDYYNIGEEGSKRYGGRLGPWAQDRYMPLLREKFNLDGDMIPFDFDEVIAAIAPRHFFSNSPVNDANFDVEGVKKGVASAKKVYALLGAEENLRVYYPDAGHDFPTDVRLKAYRFIDDILRHKAREQVLE